MTLHRNTRALFWGGLLCTLGVLFASFIIPVVAHRQFHEIAQERERHEQTARRYHVILSALKDIETGRRGFVLMQREDYLQPHHEALPVLEEEIAMLYAIASSDAQVQRELSLLEPKVRRRVQLARTSIEDIRENGVDAAR